MLLQHFLSYVLPPTRTASGTVGSNSYGANIDDHQMIHKVRKILEVQSLPTVVFDVDSKTLLKGEGIIQKGNFIGFLLSISGLFTASLIIMLPSFFVLFYEASMKSDIDDCPM